MMKKTTVACGLMVAVAGTAMADDPVQWSVDDGGTGHWYEGVYSAAVLTWQEASDFATQRGGYLATPVTEEENMWLFDSIVDDPVLWGSAGYGPFIGGWQNPDSPDYSEPDGGWEWISGETWSYESWGRGAPENCCGGQNRLQYGIGEGSIQAEWNDVAWDDVNQQFHSYVIEWDHDPSIIQWSIEDGGNGHWYQLVETKVGFLWSEAVAEAESRGGYLVSLTSADEDAWVYANFDAYDRWIGAFQDTNAADYSEPSGGWGWLSGEPLGYSNWNGGSPDNGGVADVPEEEYAHYCCGGAWNDIYGVDSFGVLNRKQMMVEYTTLPGAALGACCLDGLCITSTASDCAGVGGSWGGPNSSCSDFACPVACPGDIDGDGDVDGADLSLVLGGWGPCF